MVLRLPFTQLLIRTSGKKDFDGSSLIQHKAIRKMQAPKKTSLIRCCFSRRNMNELDGVSRFQGRCSVSVEDSPDEFIAKRILFYTSKVLLLLKDRPLAAAALCSWNLRMVRFISKHFFHRAPICEHRSMSLLLSHNAIRS